MSESQLELLSGDTTTANSGIVMSDDRQAIVELDPDHPGFRDEAYRARRNTIAQIAVDHAPGTPVPEAPYTAEEHGVSAQFVFTEPNAEQLAELSRMFDQKRLRTRVQKIYPLAEAAEAQRTQEEGHVRGKLVLNL
jgi:NADPH:quinone reductase-like Zn-dependent oxidoreductase